MLHGGDPREAAAVLHQDGGGGEGVQGQRGGCQCSS